MEADVKSQIPLSIGVVNRSGNRVKARRGKLEIIVDILTVCRDDALKTEIVYKANLNFKRVDKYLPFLEKRQLIESAGNIYRTTEKGKEFLDNYYHVRELFLSSAE